MGKLNHFSKNLRPISKSISFFERIGTCWALDPYTAWWTSWSFHSNKVSESHLHFCEHSRLETLWVLSFQLMWSFVVSQERVSWFPDVDAFKSPSILYLWTKYARSVRNSVFLVWFFHWCTNFIYQEGESLRFFIESLDRFLSIRSITYRMYFSFLCHDLWEIGNNPI